MGVIGPVLRTGSVRGSAIVASRRVARADEWGGLESRCGPRVTVGSNPTPSAMTARVLAGICSLIGFAAVVGYLAIIQNQDGWIAAISWVWAGVMALPAACTLFGTVGSDARLRRFALVFAGVVYGMLGILAIFSIGIVFLAAGVSTLLASALISSARKVEPVRPAPPV